MIWEGCNKIAYQRLVYNRKEKKDLDKITSVFGIKPIDGNY